VGLREAEPAAKDEALGGIDAGVDMMTRMTSQLLSLARAEQDHADLLRAPVDLAQIVRSALERHAARAVELGVDLGLEAEAAEVMGDAALLYEMAANLIDNALQHVKAGGSVTASVRRDEGDAVFVLEDSGPGIPKAEQERVFERFHRVLGAAGSGTGLGLAIVREIASAHGGTVGLRDRVAGAGLVVEVRLPALGSGS
jgi:two-component system sensor histidine kinase TctE